MDIEIIYVEQLPMNDDDYVRFNNKYIEYLREQRNKLLTDTDKYMTLDYPITDDNRAIIKAYRQQLRDFMDLETTKNFDCRNNIPLNLPDKPDFLN